MTQFLIRYNRRTEHGEIVSRFADDDHDAASAALLELELAKEPHEEIVLLISDSEETLHKTHGRYFYTASELTLR